MAEDLAIAVRNAAKRYVLYDQPQDRLKHSLLWRFGRTYGREFWALRDVSFEVRKGETVGIIGRNGSGKSTLLQIIAGVLAPTAGEVQVRGRLSALLELGSGFNAEFTGRENVFLSGAINGLSPDEMQSRFEDIAAFADIGQYIDQPVKLYSSGMYARLAFAAAIAIDPDILIVDEILAVGDLGFQQKCVNRLHSMRRNGLTLLFVSHSPDFVKSLCSKGLFLIEGRTAYWGSAEQAVDLYFNYVREQANLDAMRVHTELANPVSFQSGPRSTTRYGTGHVQIQAVELTDDTGARCRVFTFADWINLHVRLKAHIDVRHLSVSFLVRDVTGIDLMGTTTFDERAVLPDLHRGAELTVSFRFRNFLHLGNYGVSVALDRVSRQDGSDNILFDQVDGCVPFTVLPDPDRPVHYKFHCPVEISFRQEEG